MLVKSPRVFRLIFSLVSEYHGISSEASVEIESVYTTSHAFLSEVSDSLHRAFLTFDARLLAS